MAIQKEYRMEPRILMECEKGIVMALDSGRDFEMVLRMALLTVMEFEMVSWIAMARDSEKEFGMAFRTEYRMESRILMGF